MFPVWDTWLIMLHVTHIINMFSDKVPALNIAKVLPIYHSKWRCSIKHEISFDLVTVTFCPLFTRSPIKYLPDVQMQPLSWQNINVLHVSFWPPYKFVTSANIYAYCVTNAVYCHCFIFLYIYDVKESIVTNKIDLEKTGHTKTTFLPYPL